MSAFDGNKQRNVAYILSEQLAKVSSLLPSNLNRSLLVHHLVVACGLLRPDSNASNDTSNGEDATGATVTVVKPFPATREQLRMFHDDDYLDYVLNPNPPSSLSQAPGNQVADVQNFGIEHDCPWFKGLHLYVPIVAGATLTAVKTLTEGRADVAIAWDGGRHHAQKSHAAGFCYVADMPLALLALKRAPGRPKILYLDLDLHWSDGVSIPFSNSGSSSSLPPRILTFSIHHASPGFYPSHSLAALTPSDTSDLYTLSIPLHRGASSKTFERVWTAVERIKKTFAPEYVVVQCGVDGLAGDPMAVWNWSVDLNERGVWGGGGYHSANTARAWTYLTAIALNKPLAADMAIPEHGSWPRYAPSFSLEIEKGNMPDENGEQYLREIEERFTGLAERIRANGCETKRHRYPIELDNGVWRWTCGRPSV